MMMRGTRERFGFEDDVLSALLEAHGERLNAIAEPALPGSARRSRRVRRWGLAAATVAAGVTFALVVPSVLPGGGDAAAARALRRVALRAANQPAQPAPAPGQFVYTATQSIQISTYLSGSSVRFSYSQPLTREIWIGTDGSGRIRETPGEVKFLSPTDEQAWIAAGSPSLSDEPGAVTDETFAPGELSFLDTSALPDDPEALLDLIERREIVGGPEGDWETFTIVGDLLRETWATPAVRGALYEVAADLPGVEFVGRTRDGQGREGIAVAYTHAGLRQILIFDPRTAELLGERSVMTEDGDLEVAPSGVVITAGVGEAGEVVYTADYLASGVVDSTDERPGE